MLYTFVCIYCTYILISSILNEMEFTDQSVLSNVQIQTTREVEYKAFLANTATVNLTVI